MVKRVKTPCIGVCSTGIGDSVCRGCKRYTHEVVHWNRYSEEQRCSILARIDSLLRQVLETRIEIFDEALLVSQIERQGIRYHPEQSVFSWVFEVIKVGAGQIRQLEDFGARLSAHYRNMPLPEFKQMVDEDLFVLSTVHYERYFSGLPV